MNRIIVTSVFEETWRYARQGVGRRFGASGLEHLEMYGGTA